MWSNNLFISDSPATVFRTCTFEISDGMSLYYFFEYGSELVMPRLMRVSAMPVVSHNYHEIYRNTWIFYFGKDLLCVGTLDWPDNVPGSCSVQHYHWNLGIKIREGVRQYSIEIFVLRIVQNVELDWNFNRMIGLEQFNDCRSMMNGNGVQQPRFLSSWYGKCPSVLEKAWFFVALGEIYFLL